MTQTLPTVFLTSANPTPYIGLISDLGDPEATLEGLFPGFVTTSPINPVTAGQTSFVIGVQTSPNTILEGQITIDVFRFDIVSQPVAVPEPSNFLLLGCGLLAFAAFYRLIFNRSGLTRQSGRLGDCPH